MLFDITGICETCDEVTEICSACWGCKEHCRCRGGEGAMAKVAMEAPRERRVEAACT